MVDFLLCRSRTDGIKSVGGRRCSRLRTGSKSSACPSTRERFAENDIDISVLPDLTDQDLKDLGVSLGHRRKMLRAIARASCRRAERHRLSLADRRQTVPVRQDTAERRQVTVMFSDLVGSTALSARMDPEDLREVISAYQKCVAETVQRFGGFVAKYMGDGVLSTSAIPRPTRTTQSGPCARGWSWSLR